MKKEFTSFQTWCLTHNHKDFLDRWSDTNEISPDKIAYRSHKKVYFNCDQNKSHRPKLCTLDSIIANKNIFCDECNEHISFYEWCLQNNENLLKRWNYELNQCSPKDIGSKVHKDYYFNCEVDENHKPRKIKISSITRYDENKIKCLECNSFESWCIKNKRTDLLNLWDYDLNKIKLDEAVYSSREEYYFKCEKGIHESYPYKLSNVTKRPHRHQTCIYCNSFAQFGIDHICKDFIEKYWDFDKNININPYTLPKFSMKKVWIKCQENNYHGSYETAANNFHSGGNRCPYCVNFKIHKLDSLGYKYPKSINLWSDKNDKSPYEFSSHTNKEVWWKCENNHDDYLRRIDHSVDLNFRCPNCVRERTESLFEEKVRTYISESYGYEIHHEHQCSLVPVNPKNNHPLPFDNEVIIGNSKLYIETNGIDHYEAKFYINLAAKYNNTTPEYELHKRQLYDRYKKYIAFCNGFSYLAVPYWTEQDESYKKLIDDKITEILKQNKIAS